MNSNKIQGVVVVAQFDRKKTQDLEYHDNAEGYQAMHQENYSKWLQFGAT